MTEILPTMGKNKFVGQIALEASRAEEDIGTLRAIGTQFDTNSKLMQNIGGDAMLSDLKQLANEAGEVADSHHRHEIRDLILGSNNDLSEVTRRVWLTSDCLAVTQPARPQLPNHSILPQGMRSQEECEQFSDVTNAERILVNDDLAGSHSPRSQHSLGTWSLAGTPSDADMRDIISLPDEVSVSGVFSEPPTPILDGLDLALASEIVNEFGVGELAMGYLIG